MTLGAGRMHFPCEGVVLAELQIDYQTEPDLSAAEFIDVLRRSTLADRRPVDDFPRIDQMLRNASLILVARHAGRIVGVARSMTDFAYCTYLSDLAVDVAYQGHQIGRQLLYRTWETAGRQTRLILLAAPAAETYYPHVGLLPHHSCWMIPPEGGR